MVTQVPQVTNWSVTPQNGQVGYFTRMNTWLFESTSVIASFNTAISKINEAGEDINNIGQNAINAITFDNIAQLKLNSNIGRVDVLGYYIKGDGGGGQFYWDSASTETDNGGTIIQATGITTGRWKRVLTDTISAKEFGIKSNLTDDDTISLQSFFTFLSTGKYKGTAIGNCLISQPIIFNGGFESSCDFNLKLTTNVLLDYAFKFYNHRGINFNGEIEAYSSSFVYANRKLIDGIIVEDCRGSHFDKLTVNGALREGVTFSGTGNNIVCSVNEIRTHYCGSSITNDYKVSKTYTSKADAGVASSETQRSSFNIDAIPTYLRIGDTCNIASTPYLITNITGLNIEVYPWITSTSTTGTVEFYIGNGVACYGSNGANININSIDSTFSASAIASKGLFGCTVQSVTSQFCGVGIIIGASKASSYYGTLISSYYSEGNAFDAVSVTAQNDGLTILGHFFEQSGDVYKLAPLTALRHYNGVACISDTSVFINNGKVLKNRVGEYAFGAYLSSETLIAENEHISLKGGNTITISIGLNLERFRFFGHNYQRFTIYGRRTGNRVDTITINPTDPAHTVMGVASYVISSVTTVKVIEVWFDYEANNWVVTQIK